VLCCSAVARRFSAAGLAPAGRAGGRADVPPGDPYVVPFPAAGRPICGPPHRQKMSEDWGVPGGVTTPGQHIIGAQAWRGRARRLNALMFIDSTLT